MPRRTPLEVAIAQQTERQAQYEKRQRDAGLTKACAWCPTSCASDWKEIARVMTRFAGDPAALKSMCRDLGGMLERWREMEPDAAPEGRPDPR